jgi:hypothetical protein
MVAGNPKAAGLAMEAEAAYEAEAIEAEAAYEAEAIEAEAIEAEAIEAEAIEAEAIEAEAIEAEADNIFKRRFFFEKVILFLVEFNFVMI